MYPDRQVLRRPNTIRFNARHLVQLKAEDVYDAINHELDTVKTIKSIAPLDNGWYNVTFDNEGHCERIAQQGVILQDLLIQCERANVENSVVAYVKVPYEMSDMVVINALMPYGTVVNTRRQCHDFDPAVETGCKKYVDKKFKETYSKLRTSGRFLPTSEVPWTTENL